MEVSRYKNANQAFFNGMQSLFHYQPLSSEQHKEWLTETLLQNKIYCSNQADFNDPWDMNPLVKRLDNERDRTAFVAYLRSAPLDNEASKRIDENISNHAWLDKLAQNLAVGRGEMFKKNLRVYCLTSKPDNLLMWSHYADKHRGICLEFDTNNFTFGSAWEVEYHEEYPYSVWDNDHDTMRTALTKAKCWAYEEEYRVLPKTECVSDFLSHKLRVDSEYKLLFPPNALKSVIVGCKADYDEILSFIQSIRPDLPVKRAILQSNRYELHIE